MALSPVMVELRATTGEFMAKMGEARVEVQKLAHEGSSHFDKFSAVGKAAFAGIAGGALAIGTIAVKAAIEGEASHARLAQAIKNTGGSMEALQPQVDNLSSRFAKFGFTNDDVEAALAGMTTSLGSSQKALGAMGLAADLAKFKHIGLSDASLAVAKAMEGQLRPLKQLGIDLPVAAGGAKALAAAHMQLSTATDKLTTFLKIHPDAVNASSKSHGVYLQMLDKVQAAQGKVTAATGAAMSITKALSAAVGGQAAAAADTYAGKVEATQAQVHNLAEKLGNALLPVITQVTAKISEAVDWFGRHKTAAEALAAVLGGALTLAIGTYFVGALMSASKALTLTGRAAQLFGVEAAEGETAATLPLLPWIAAVAAVGFAAYELYKHWDTVWGAIKTATSAAVGFVKDHLLLIAIAIGPVAIIAVELYKHWSTVWSGIQTVTSGVWSVLKTIFHAVVAVGLAPIKAEIAAFKAVWDLAWAGAHAAVSAAWAVIQPVIASIHSAISGVTSAISSIKAAADDVANVAGKVTSVAKNPAGAAKSVLGKIIPHFATGVQNFPGGVALVGEQGPELVDLPGGSNVYPHGTGPGGNNITIQVDGRVSSPHEVAHEIAWLLKTA